jgi:hypothetical protein
MEADALPKEAQLAEEVA